jgi:hypothetical protein
LDSECAVGKHCAFDWSEVEAGAHGIDLLPCAIEKFNLVELDADESASVGLRELAVRQMAESPHLPDEVLIKVREVLDRVRVELTTLSSGDAKTLHHARRYLMKRLEFDERSRPADRNKLKLTLMARQQGKCPDCGEPLPSRDSELDRADPVLGYTEENCRLVHHACHRKAQALKGYS